MIPGGGLAADGTRWVVACRPGFFLPVLSRLLRRLFLERLQHALDIGALRFFTSLAHLSEPGEFARYLPGPRQTEWAVYAKEPFGGPQQVLDYLGRYTHRVAISNNRLISQTERHVTFRWKDYHDPGRPRVMRLDAPEFLRRFLLHVLPHGLQRIRHYGLLSNRLCETSLAACRGLLGAPPAETRVTSGPDYRDRFAQLTSRSLRDCPVCKARSHGLRRIPFAWRAAIPAMRHEPALLLGAEPGTSCGSARHACSLRLQRASLLRPKPPVDHHAWTCLPNLLALASLPAFDAHNRRRADSIPIATGGGAA